MVLSYKWYVWLALLSLIVMSDSRSQIAPIKDMSSVIDITEDSHAFTLEEEKILNSGNVSEILECFFHMNTILPSADPIIKARFDSLFLKYNITIA